MNVFKKKCNVLRLCFLICAKADTKSILSFASLCETKNHTTNDLISDSEAKLVSLLV